MAFLEQIYLTDGGRIGMAAVLLLALGTGIASLAVTISNRRLLKRIFGGTQGQEFQDRLGAILRAFEDQAAIEREVRNSLADLQQTSHSFYDTVDIEHYDAFAGQAGRLSFSLLMLNRNGFGIVLTSLTNTTGSKVYVKHIENGKSDTALSHEEEELLRRNSRS